MPPFLPTTLLISRRMRVIWRHEISLHRHSRPRVHPRRDKLSGWGRPVVLQFQYGLLSLVTQSIVSSSPYDRLSLSKFARPVVCLAGRLPLSQMSRPLLSSHLLHPSGSVFDILLSVARIDDSATAETNADSGRRRRRHGMATVRCAWESDRATDATDGCE